MAISIALGGWARLALVLSVLWTLLIGTVSWARLPTFDGSGRDILVPTVYDPATNELVTMKEALRRTGASTPPGRSSSIPNRETTAHSTELSDDDLLEIANDPRVTTKDLERLTLGERQRFTTALERGREALLSRRMTHIRTALLLWVAPILALFALGYTIRWIYRGFRPLS